MPVSLLGDQPFENTPSLEAKALRINLNDNIYVGMGPKGLPL